MRVRQALLETEARQLLREMLEEMPLSHARQELRKLGYAVDNNLVQEMAWEDDEESSSGEEEVTAAPAPGSATDVPLAYADEFYAK